MSDDGTLKRVLTKQAQFKPAPHQAISYAKVERENYGKLKPEELRPLIAQDVEEYLNAGNKITMVPIGKTGIVEY